MPDPVATPLDFPLRGLDTSVAAGLQKPLTTPVGANVRGPDPFARRVRGGARTGLSRYVNERVNGVSAVQCIDFVVTQDYAATLYAADQSSTTGVRVLDPATSNFPNGPGATGPGGGPEAPAAPPSPPNFNRRHSETATVLQGGNGVMQARTTSLSPPPPPATLTRTYTPFATVYDTEHVGKFSVGPFSVPLTPPTDLAPTAVDFFGNLWNIDLSAWSGAGLPTVAQINALFVAAGWNDGGTPSGPYETSVDS